MTGRPGGRQPDRQRGHRLGRPGAESVLSPGVQVQSWARVERAVVLHNGRIGRRAVVQDAILDKNVVVLAGATVGVDKEQDRLRGFTVLGRRDHRGGQGAGHTTLTCRVALYRLPGRNSMIVNSTGSI